jgi:hypothetical protein
MVASNTQSVWTWWRTEISAPVEIRELELRLSHLVILMIELPHLSNSMDQNPFWEANRSDSQDIPRLFAQSCSQEAATGQHSVRWIQSIS